MRSLIISIIVLFTVACGPQTPKEELNVVMEDMIELLNEGDLREFFDGYTNLSDVKDPEKELSPENRKILIDYLGKSLELEPTLSEDDTVAIYNDSSFIRRLRFEKVDGQWLFTGS